MLPPTDRRELFALKKGSKMAELLEVKNLSVSFDTPDGEAEAVRDVSFFVKKGETLAIVGESGCGKSVLCRSIMKLLPKTARIKSGSVLLDGKEITGLTEKEMQKLRGNSFSMVFQDPMTTLNPAMTVGAQIAEAVIIHRPELSREEVRCRLGAHGAGGYRPSEGAGRPVSLEFFRGNEAEECACHCPGLGAGGASGG